MGHIGGRIDPRIVKGMGVWPTNRTIRYSPLSMILAEKNFRAYHYILYYDYISKGFPVFGFQKMPYLWAFVLTIRIIRISRIIVNDLFSGLVFILCGCNRWRFFWRVS